VSGQRERHDDGWELSAVAHELRAPLAIISGYAELLRVREDERMRLEASVLIQEAAEQLSARIDDALLLLSVARNEVDVELSAVDLGPVVRKAVSEVAAEHAAHALLLIVDDEEPQVVADAARLPQLVTRLLDAVCTALPSGARILVRVSRHDGQAVVAAGSPEPWTLREGARLSLHLAQRLAELYGGSLTIDEDDGRGTVTLALPEPGGSDSRIREQSRSRQQF
jgi:signal transduction histidine kinase